ncbi:MAG TPA: DNA methyltransferase [Thermoleophilaceae bacterium]|nr:DNA methyltransferase [Thermoleophilaceae bacterium]
MYRATIEAPNDRCHHAVAPALPLEDQGATPSDHADAVAEAVPVRSFSTEKLGSRTQKPVALLKPIIEAPCPPDVVVLDPFCGCGRQCRRLTPRKALGWHRHHGPGHRRDAESRLKDEFGQTDAAAIGEP